MVLAIGRERADAKTGECAPYGGPSIPGFSSHSRCPPREPSRHSTPKAKSAGSRTSMLLSETPAASPAARRQPCPPSIGARRPRWAQAAATGEDRRECRRQVALRWQGHRAATAQAGRLGRRACRRVPPRQSRETARRTRRHLQQRRGVAPDAAVGVAFLQRKNDIVPTGSGKRHRLRPTGAPVRFTGNTPLVASPAHVGARVREDHGVGLHPARQAFTNSRTTSPRPLSGVERRQFEERRRRRPVTPLGDNPAAAPAPSRPRSSRCVFTEWDLSRGVSLRSADRTWNPSDGHRHRNPRTPVC